MAYERTINRGDVLCITRGVYLFPDKGRGPTLSGTPIMIYSQNETKMFLVQEADRRIDNTDALCVLTEDGLVGWLWTSHHADYLLL